MAKNTVKSSLSILARADFQSLFDALKKKGYETVGPTVRDEAIVLDPITSAADLPEGWTDEQSGAHYRLKRRGDKALFGYVVGARSAKSFLHSPRAILWSGLRESLEQSGNGTAAPQYAFIGIRPCDLKAILIQDDVLTRGPYGDALYAARRKNTFLAVVNCTNPGGNCFCASMNTGPRATGDFDLAITEILDQNGHRFLIESGSKKGEEVIKELPVHDAPTADVEAANRDLDHAASRMGRNLDTEGLRELLQEAVEHPRWDDVAARCLACANCTMVCPTCFCVNVEDYTSLKGDRAERHRRWDSCFTLDFSYIHGGSIRQSPRARYRHWMTHKLSAWVDQFGIMGCVGCGRCITWCPVGIDITEEAAAIRSTAITKEVADGDD